MYFNSYLNGKQRGKNLTILPPKLQLLWRSQAHRKDGYSVDTDPDAFGDDARLNSASK